MGKGDEDWVKKCMEYRVEGRRVHSSEVTQYREVLLGYYKLIREIIISLNERDRADPLLSKLSFSSCKRRTEKENVFNFIVDDDEFSYLKKSASGKENVFNFIVDDDEFSNLKKSASGMTSVLQQPMSVSKMRYVNSAFQMRLTHEHLKTNFLAGCNINDSVKTKLLTIFFIHFIH